MKIRQSRSVTTTTATSLLTDRLFLISKARRLVNHESLHRESEELYRARSNKLRELDILCSYIGLWHDWAWSEYSTRLKGESIRKKEVEQLDFVVV